MKPLHYIILSVILVYLVSGAIFSYISLKYRKNFKRIRSAANILIRDVNEDLTKIKQTCEANGVNFDYTPFVFSPESDDEINNNREHIYRTIDNAKEVVKSLVDKVFNEKDKEKIVNIIYNIDTNLANYRRLVLKHNKVIDNYNYNAQSILFVVFARILHLEREDHI
jgi:hypothetical protein